MAVPIMILNLIQSQGNKPQRKTPLLEQSLSIQTAPITLVVI